MTTLPSAAGGDEARLRVRQAVGSCLDDLDPSCPVVVGVSGGADSLALARGVAGRPCVAVVVDHGLQEDSGVVADRAAAHCAELGIAEVLVERVVVRREGLGPEAAARQARRAALEQIADRVGSPAILLGHTLDDQAETVLLRLARGSGARSLAAMAPVSGRWRRPLLGLPRSLVRASVADLDVWEDPQNEDPSYARVRVRSSALPALSEALGQDAVTGLARSARLLRDDADCLDELARAALAELAEGDRPDGLDLDATALASLARAIRTRVIRWTALRAGCPPESLTAEHVDRVEALVSDWHGQGAVDLPGGISAARACGRLTFLRATPVAERRRREGEG